MKYLISILIGAIIGYLTNWLAIKMLFRPYEEKRIFNIKIPFTPGLIPKERYRISKSVGKAVGEHLLTEETLTKSLERKEVKDKVYEIITDKIDKVFNGEKPIGELTKKIFKENNDQVILNYEDKLSKALMEYVKKEEFKKESYALVKEGIDKVFSYPLNKIIKDEYRSNIKNTIFNLINNYKSSKEFNDKVINYFQNKLEKKIEEGTKLNEIVPDFIQDGAQDYVFDHREEIANEIKDFLKQDQSKESIRNIIDDIIKNKLNPMMAMFLNTDSIYDKFTSIISEILDEEKNKIGIARFINNELEKVMQNHLETVVNGFNEEDRKGVIVDIANLFENKVLSEDFLVEILNNIEEKMDDKKLTLNTLIEEVGSSKEKIINFFYNKIITSNSFESVIKSLSKKVIHYVLNKKIMDIISIESIGRSINKETIVNKIYCEMIKDSSEDIIKSLDIANIVEEKINELDVRFTEDIIIEIANRELKAITWLGALLGGILGILTPFISSLL